MDMPNTEVKISVNGFSGRGSERTLRCIRRLINAGETMARFRHAVSSVLKSAIVRDKDGSERTVHRVNILS